jgi:hypothetical protein
MLSGGHSMEKFGVFITKSLPFDIPSLPPKNIMLLQQLFDVYA